MIAISGSQVFVAVGREVRWADMNDLKERYHEQQLARGRPLFNSNSSGRDELLDAAAQDFYAGFRTIKVPSVVADIQQLVISPHGEFLAVLTSHTVRICVVPDLANLTAPSNDVIKPKAWTLGPTTHVQERSPVVSALWHPLGVNGSALVTVTNDAVVRVWELSATDRWSFDTPSLTIDLKKLADGTFLDQNFSASTNTSKGFSPDSFEMDVAAACFSRRGSGGWSPMTLWVAMREGDVYALCPLLPTKWSPPPTLIPSLSVAIVGNLAAITDEPDASAQEKLLAQQQFDWMSEIDKQEPMEVDGPPGEPPVDVYMRPSKPGVVPRLQGPFEIEMSPDTELDMDIELTDIHVIGQKLDTDELMMGEDEELEHDIDTQGLSLNIVCLLSTSGQLRICLDLEGVQAQWLPPRQKSKAVESLAHAESPSLLTFQTLDILGNLEMSEVGWPMFSTDYTSRYAFYITHPACITYISLDRWVFSLEGELSGDSAGSDFRIDLLVKGQSTTRERLYTAPSRGDTNLHLAAAVTLQDPDLGYILLSATPHEPVALIFDAPEYDLQPIQLVPPDQHGAEDMQPLDFYEPRQVFQEPHVFDIGSALPGLLDKLRTCRYKAIVGQEVRLSPVTLTIFTDAHKILSEETHRLGGAASELFRRLEGLQVELKQQIVKASEVRARVQTISGEENSDDYEAETSNASVERRLEAARVKGELISQRLDKIRRTVSRAITRELSDKERAWVNEVNEVNESISGSAASSGSSKLKKVGQRYAEAKLLREDVVSQAEKLVELTTGKGEANANSNAAASSPDLRIPADLRKAKINQVQKQLERETALVDAVKARLERLSVVG